MVLMSSMAGLSDLDFGPGLEIEKLVGQQFSCAVSPPPAAPGFLLVASFGRSSVRLNEDSVSLLLQSCLGGVAKDFNVVFLSGWMFRFSISCKKVGLLVYQLKNFSCKIFSIFFLWGNGGPNWTKDFAVWCQEHEAEWSIVGRKGKSLPMAGKKSYAEIVKSQRQSPQVSIFKRLSFPSDYVRNYSDVNDQSSQNFVARRPSSEKKGHRRVWVPKESQVKSSDFAELLKAGTLNDPVILPASSNLNPHGPRPGPNRICFSCSGPG